MSRSRTFRSEEHTSELQSLRHLVCRLLLEKKKKNIETGGWGEVRGVVCGTRRHASWCWRRCCAGPNWNSCPVIVLSTLRSFFFFLNDGAPPELHSLPPRRSLRF